MVHFWCTTPQQLAKTRLEKGVVVFGESIYGVLFTITPDIGVIEGVDAARNILLRCWFDEEKCSKGITALESYRKDWNEQLGCWSSRPLHNFASHGADAFRMLAVGLGQLATKGLSAEAWENLRKKYTI
jgi:hypothetical protein